MKVWKKPAVIATASAVVISSVLMANTSFAANATKKLTAVYSNIVIKYNGGQVATDSTNEPFMVNGTTFVPVRLIAQATGSEVLWDQTSKTISISGGTSAEDQATINSLTQSLAEANIKIQQLQASLNAALEEEETDIDDVESDIQDEYEDYDDTDASITISGDEDDVTVTIKVDPDGWGDLSDSKQEQYLQDIVDDILDVYEDADVSGTVRSNEGSTKLATFETDGNGNVELETTAADLNDLEDELNDDYGDFADVSFDIELSGDEDDITIEVYVNEDAWNNMSSNDKEDLQDSLIEDVEDEYPDADIEGTVYSSDDDSRLDTF